MTGIEKSLLRVIATVLLYALASPILLLKAIAAFWKQLSTIDRIRSGSITCPWCGDAIQLNRVARCTVCSATTPGSLLQCSHCHSTFATVTCDACTSTVKVL